MGTHACALTPEGARERDRRDLLTTERARLCSYSFMVGTETVLNSCCCSMCTHKLTVSTVIKTVDKTQVNERALLGVPNDRESCAAVKWCSFISFVFIGNPHTHSYVIMHEIR